MFLAVVIIVLILVVTFFFSRKGNGQTRIGADGRNSKSVSKDAWESVYFGDQDDSRPVSVTADIEYVDRDGQFTRRRITTSQFCSWEGGWAIHAHCHMRDANRTLLTSRMKSFVDADTGEIISDVGAYLTRTYHESPSGRLAASVDELLDCLKILVFVARADGRFMSAEVEEIVSFLTKHSSADLSDVPPKDLQSTIRELEVNQTEFRRRLKAVAQGNSGELLVDLKECVGRVAKTRKSSNEFLDAAVSVVNKTVLKVPKLQD